MSIGIKKAVFDALNDEVGPVHCQYAPGFLHITGSGTMTVDLQASVPGGDFETREQYTSGDSVVLERGFLWKAVCSAYTSGTLTVSIGENV